MSKHRIRELNDAFRKTFLGGRVLVTPAVRELPPDKSALLFTHIRTFSKFDTDNDPHAEHDFGSIELADRTWFFKIDYYRPDMNGGSEHPEDPNQTVRVMTIMRADEY
jgi:Protein of unknown function (DUF3768)